MTNVSLRRLLGGTAAAAGLFAILLTIKAVSAFSRQGPAIREQIESHYLGYAIWSVARLALVAFLIAWLLALAGAVVQAAFLPTKRRPWLGAFLAGGVGIALGTAQQFAQALIHEPSTLLASWLYDPRHLVTAWFWIDPRWLTAIRAMLALLIVLSIFVLAWRLARDRRPGAATAVIALPVVFVGTLLFTEGVFGRSGPDEIYPGSPDKPNIIMIGSDTLRADRFGIEGYSRKITPYIDQLSRKGYWFSQAYTPIARTAPSLMTLLTGAWPRQHGVTSNFVPAENTKLPVAALPELLREAGYRTGAVSDWAGSDLSKMKLGFDETQTAPDQWNLKYLLRQGPKDLRLFISLFTRNELSRRLLPEMYYLAGRPLSTEVGHATRLMIDRFSSEEKPFFIVSFLSTTHGPFGSEYPYYTLFSGYDYHGASKFAITGVYSPENIAKRQAQGAEAFDVQQIVNLYDGAVRRFDDEVKRIVEHLKKRGLLKNTIVVIFSDHGTDLFERGTWGQGNTVMGEDPSNRIPLLIVDPRRPGNRVIDATVRALDLPATLLELAGADPLALGTAGKSLVPYLDSKEQRNRSAYFATGAWLARVKGMAEDHVQVPPLLELLEIPDYDDGNLAISREGQKLIEASRDRALRYGPWKMVRIPTNKGPRFHFISTSSTTILANPEIEQKVRNCMKKGLGAWAEQPVALSIYKCTGSSKVK